MKKILQTLLLLVFAAGAAHAQFSPYNRSVSVNLSRGASPANDTTTLSESATSSDVYESPNNPSATGQFFPNITNGAYKLRAVNAATAGEFKLEGGTLIMRNAGSNVAKTIVYDIANAAAIAKFSFKLDLTGYNAASPFLIAIGSSSAPAARLISGTLSTFTSKQADIFGSMRIFKNASSVIENNYRSSDGASIMIAATSLIIPGQVCNIEIFANSSATATTYTYPGVVTPVSLASNTYHVYVNGTKFTENFPKAGDTYSQSSINTLTLSYVGGTTQETVKISNIVATYPSATPLPVSLVSFTGQKENAGIRLNWKTASELNNSHFDLLRSTDGKNFATLTSISGNGTSQQTHTYSYLDNTAEKGTNYYKLKQVDNDGTATTSDIIVAVDNALSAQQAFSIRFNGSNELNAQFDASASGAATISIRDLSGRTVVSQSFNAQKGANNINLQIPSLTAGIYVATLAQNDQINSIKIIK